MRYINPRYLLYLLTFIARLSVYSMMHAFITSILLLMLFRGDSCCLMLQLKSLSA